MRVPVVTQRWESVSFLHWRYDPEVVAKLLPPGLVPDVRDGATWIGLSPFLIARHRLGPGLPLAGLGRFPETNVRAYARGKDGRDGIVFLSLDVDSRMTAVLGRSLYRVAYQEAEMTVRAVDGSVIYDARRKDGDARHHIEVRPGADVAPDDELAHWLTGRWRAWTRYGAVNATVAVEHEPWPLRASEVVALDTNLLEAAGLPAPLDQPVAHFSPGVTTKIGAPRPAKATL